MILFVDCVKIIYRIINEYVSTAENAGNITLEFSDFGTLKNFNFGTSFQNSTRLESCFSTHPNVSEHFQIDKVKIVDWKPVSERIKSCSLACSSYDQRIRGDNSRRADTISYREATQRGRHSVATRKATRKRAKGWIPTGRFLIR